MVSYVHTLVTMVEVPNKISFHSIELPEMTQNYFPVLQKMISEKVEQDATFHPLTLLPLG